MKRSIVVIPVLVVLAAALLAGCTGTTPGPVTTPTPTPAATAPPATMVTVPATTLGSLEPGPTVTLPPGYTVSVDVVRDPVSLNKKITVVFQGGAGQSATQRVDVRVTHDDGTSETKSIIRPETGGSLKKGDEVFFNGSDRDRVEVTITQNGIPYRIIDQIYSFKTRP